MASYYLLTPFCQTEINFGAMGTTDIYRHFCNTLQEGIEWESQ